VAIEAVTRVLGRGVAPLPLLVAAQAASGAAVLGLMLTWGPLRPVRVQLRDRVAGAYGDGGRGVAVALRLLSIGDRGTGRAGVRR
jgi:hypothetical protein